MEPQQIFLLIWAIMAVAMLTILCLRGNKALEIFPPVESENLLFREKGASGNSRKSLKTKLGGARNVLEVIITDKELWIRSPLLFAGFGKTYDLLHKIPLNNILDVEFNKKKVVILFKTKDSSDTTLDLKLKNAQEFVEIIKKKSLQHSV